MNWDQAMCNDCWNAKNPNRQPVTLNDRTIEICAWCGNDTASGIYVREHPGKVSFPTAEEGGEVKYYTHQNVELFQMAVEHFDVRFDEIDKIDRATRTVHLHNGRELTVPEDWDLL